MVNDILSLKYVDLGVLENKLKGLFKDEYTIEDKGDRYLLTIPRKLEGDEKKDIQNETERKRNAKK